MKLRELAHARTGDKGDTSQISVIAYEPGDYAFLAEHVTAERVRAHFAPILRGEVTRYELPGLGALNFVMTGALAGGVTRSLSLDAHGKCLGSVLLELEIPDRMLEQNTGTVLDGRQVPATEAGRNAHFRADLDDAARRRFLAEFPHAPSAGSSARA